MTKIGPTEIKVSGSCASPQAPPLPTGLDFWLSRLSRLWRGLRSHQCCWEHGKMYL